MPLLVCQKQVQWAQGLDSSGHGLRGVQTDWGGERIRIGMQAGELSPHYCSLALSNFPDDQVITLLPCLVAIAEPW